MTNLYNDTSAGYAGNDDCGEMSAWYVFGVLVFYPVNPVSGSYVLGTLLVEKAAISLPGGKTFMIKALRRKGDEIYVRSVKLNGRKYESCYLKHQDIMQGERLSLKCLINR